jgi:phosphoglycerol transferase
MTAARPRAAPSDERRRGGRIGALATLLLVSLGAYLALELWRANLSVPFRYAQIDDTKFYFGLVKGIIDHGWYLHNPNLAAPLGQALYDFPQGADNLNFLLIRAISLLSSNYALVTNLFFLLTFPLTGLAAHYAFRRLGVRPAAATACAVLFALLPFHFYRHESQVLLSAYYAVPLGAYLFLAVFAEEPLFPARPGAPPALAWASRRSLATLLACVVIGSAGLYYAVFAICLLLGGALVAGFAHRGRRAVLTGLAATAAIAVTVTVNLAPSLINSARHGGDPAIARTPVESEQLGLRLSNLVLPVRSHRLPLLSNLNTQYAADTSPGYCESCNETLGVVGAVGFVLLGLVALAAIAGAASSQTPDRAWRGPLRPAALGVALAFAVGTTGGISALIAFLITPDVRGWNRISLYIAFFSLLAVGLLLDHARPPDAGPRRRRLAGLLLMVVLVVGWLDETSTFFVVDYKASAREYQSDRAFGRLIQSRLPPGASVLELPYVPFPEGYHLAGSAPSTAFSTSYDLLRPYLSTDGLHWSFGAIKGRPSDWESALAAKRLDLVAAAAVAAGFQAIYVDPHGYNDPVLAHRVAVGLTELLGSPPLLSPRRDVWLFGLGRYRLRLERRAGPAALAALREATLRPLRTECATTPDVIVLSNPSRSPRPAVLTAALTAPLPGGVRIRITFPDGSTELRALDATVAHLHRRLLVVPGQSRVRIAIVGDFPFATSPFSPAFIVSVPTLVDDAFAPFRTRRRGLEAALPVAGLVGPTCNDLYQTSAASKLPSAYPQRPRPRAPAARPLH